MNLSNQKLKAILGVILIAILTASMIIAHQKDLKKETPKEEIKQEKVEKKEFTESEIIVWNLFLEEGKKNKFIDESNLDTIELISIEDYGRYLKSKPDLRYEQINFKYTCKDKTPDCVKANKPDCVKANKNIDYYSQLVTINLKDKTYIKIGGLSFGQNEQFESVTETFTYYDLEN